MVHVGLNVGLTLGDADGEREGETDGLADGDVVGDVLGESDGLIEGDEVVCDVTWKKGRADNVQKRDTEKDEGTPRKRKRRQDPDN